MRTQDRAWLLLCHAVGEHFYSMSDDIMNSVMTRVLKSARDFEAHPDFSHDD